VLAFLAPAPPVRPASAADLAAPLVHLDPPVLVEVLERDVWHLGLATACRGTRVSASWTLAPGLRRMTWVPAALVRRTTVTQTNERRLRSDRSTGPSERA